MAFIDQEPNKTMVNHKNSNRLDNKVENLEWVTHTENIHHGYINRPVCKGCRYISNMKKYFARIVFNKKEYPLGYFLTAEDAHQAYVKAFNKMHNTN